MLVFLLIGERPPLRPPQHRCSDTSSRLTKRRNAVGSQTPTSAGVTAGTCICRDDTTNSAGVVHMPGGIYRGSVTRGPPVPNLPLARWVVVRRSSATIRGEPVAIGLRRWKGSGATSASSTSASPEDQEGG